VNNEQLIADSEDESEFIEEANETCECQAEIETLRSRIDMLTKDNAELITDNLALRAKTEALLEARAALPEFSVPTQLHSDKYIGLKDAFKIATKRK